MLKKLLVMLILAAMLCPFAAAAENGQRVIVFGRWEQDGNEANGPEPLRWRILCEEGGAAYALCDSVIEIRAFGGAMTKWANCSLRTWLNGDFFETAFQESEKAAIVKREQLNLGNDFWVASDDSPSSDLVFLPSRMEIEKLMGNPADRIAAPTAYAIAQGRLPQDAGGVCWWLRTNGVMPGEAMNVREDGVINNGGTYGGEQMGVRPAIWLQGAATGGEDSLQPVPTIAPLPQPDFPPIEDTYEPGIPYFPAPAYTNADQVNVRLKPNGDIIERIEFRGTAVTVLGEAKDPDGGKWYVATLSNGLVGYIRSDLVSFSVDPGWGVSQ